MKILALFFLVCFPVGVAAPLFAQSLADVARQEEARRKAIRAPAKVITNTDLKPVLPPESAPAPPPATSTATTPDVTAQPADAAAPAGDVKDQAYWSGRLKALQTQLERDQTFAEAVQVQINALTTDFENRGDPAQRAVIGNNRTKALAELDRLRKAITDDQKAIADFQEEASRAGVPPGWLR